MYNLKNKLPVLLSKKKFGYEQISEKKETIDTTANGLKNHLQNNQTQETD